ncbi:MAG: Stress responsive A/B Barrel Domain protein [candidate division BRC1 bacterium ADurb.BinA364]|nr:MAG: Stress responsive A/B Barrel Domain protein [candidate division BRC1 bacterium ADurb.BinA364]
MVKHVVLMQKKSETSEAQMDELMSQLAALKKAIPDIRDFQGGKNVSIEGMARGYTHGFVMTFDSTEKIAAYLPHPEHKKAGARVKELCDSVLVMDF